jgi:hypothetical protein
MEIESEAKMANKSILRVQVSLRRVVDFNEEQHSEHDKKTQSDDKTAVQGAKASKAQASR